MYFCAACAVYVREASEAEHDASTAHLLSTTKAPALRKGWCFWCRSLSGLLTRVSDLRTAVAVTVWLPESNRGYRMLMGMGWTQGAGLGPTGAGRVEPVATVLKTDRAGVGAYGSTAKAARVTHFPPYDEQQQQRLRERKRALEQTGAPVSQTAERKARKLQDQQRDRALGRELYGTGDLDGYEEFFQ